MAESMKDLATRIKVVPQGQNKPLDADRLRAQFIKAVEEVEAGLTAKHGEFSKDLTQALSALAKGQGEGKLGDLLSRSSKSEAGDRQGESGQGQAGANPAPARSAEAASAAPQSGLAGGNPRQGGAEAQAQAQGRAAQAEPSFGAAINRAGQAAAADQATGPRAVLPAHVVRQVGQALTQMVAKEQTTLRLELKPPSLGELNLELAVKDGNVTAKLVAENAAAKQALEAGMDQLKQDLANQGLKIARVEITVNPDAQRAQAQAGGEGHNRGGRSGSRAQGGETAGGVGSDEDETNPAGFPARGAGARISVFA
ncbi:MAG: hypothetical protein C0405_09475 [Desulfovibrio sp.]|nr:hypothetical protein [Desulfovibrio sp.]